MARFCPQCGTQQGDGARFCGKCGTPIPVIEPQAPVNPQPEQPYAQPQENYYAQPEQQVPPQENYYAQSEPQYAQPENSYIPPQPPKKSNKKTIAIIVGAIALIAAIVIALFATGVIGGSKEDNKFASPESVAMAFFDALKNGNAREYVNCAPSFVFEDSEEKQETIEYLEEMFEDLFEEDYGKAIQKAKFTVDEVDELSSYEILLLEAELKYYDFDMDDITDYRKVTVKMTGSYDREFELLVIKYKGEWKIGNFQNFLE